MGFVLDSPPRPFTQPFFADANYSSSILHHLWLWKNTKSRRRPILSRHIHSSALVFPVSVFNMFSRPIRFGDQQFLELNTLYLIHRITVLPNRHPTGLEI